MPNFSRAAARSVSLASCFILLLPTLVCGVARATTYALNIDAKTIQLGEARYFVNPSADDSYTNAYFDYGDELTALNGQLIGWVENSGFHATVAVFLDDVASNDCKDLWVCTDFWLLNESESCYDDGYNIGGSCHEVDTCQYAGGGADGYFGLVTLSSHFDESWFLSEGQGGHGYNKVVYTIETRYGDTVHSSDAGCFSVAAP